MGIDGLIVLDKTGLVLSSLYCPFSLITESVAQLYSLASGQPQPHTPSSMWTRSTMRLTTLDALPMLIQFCIFPLTIPSNLQVLVAIFLAPI